jgi:hypothetical protein
MKKTPERFHVRSIFSWRLAVVIGGLTILLLVPSLLASAQAPKGGDKKNPPSAATKVETAIPRFRVRPRATELSALEGTLSRTAVGGDDRPLVAPPALNGEARSRLLRESGFDVGVRSAPREFRLSPQKPYVSSSAYLFFSAGLEFNAADDSLVMRSVVTSLTIPDWTGVGARSSNPYSILGVLIRMDAGSQYLVDFSVSSETSTIYELTVTGAEGAGTFRRERGAHHVVALLGSDAAGYARLNFWGRRVPTLSDSPATFTFHNVVVTKLD